jgi:restriction system protein
MSSSGKISARYSQRGSATYYIEVWHDELGKHKEIRSKNKHELQARASELMEKWDAEWKHHQRGKEAEHRTTQARATMGAVEGILEHTVEVDDSIDFKSLRATSEYPVNKPEHPPLPKKGCMAAFLPSAQAKHQKEVEELERHFASQVENWEKEKKEFEEAQEKKNQAIANFEKQYFASEPDAIREYCGLVLQRSLYPSQFPAQVELNYNPDNKILVVDYRLPAPSDIPTLESVRYVKSTGHFKEKHISRTAHQKLYDQVAYQIAIRTIHELYEADQASHLASVVFNGFVHTIDPATGKEITPCILSVQANQEEFQSLVLENVDAKACFRRLKGVGSSKLHALAPVAPLLQFDKSDSRFVEGHAVVGGLAEGDNLAAMEWEEFEHLIREIFEEEFSADGGEVKITRASRDRGVDAIAFDPDPIKGGKIVIQAKRYTNTVGVDAVRDLYGTVINEGAGKGILVTTSDYGPDAYEFAKGKPITLLNGGNLLHLLDKHGHRATIDIQEARRVLAEREKEKNG